MVQPHRAFRFGDVDQVQMQTIACNISRHSAQLLIRGLSSDLNLTITIIV